MIDIQQEVRVRKFEVDIPNLQNLLRQAKKDRKITNKQIAEQLNIPLTKVEHWFRTDNSFAIPDENLWFDLKQLLHITDDSFDESIMTFEVREGVYEKSNRCYYEEGIAPTITCMCGNEKIITNNVYIVDDLYANREPRIYKNECPTLRNGRSGLKVIEEFPVCCAIRGRYNEDGKIEQKLEIGSSDYANAITTVQKDCMIIEKIEK